MSERNSQNSKYANVFPDHSWKLHPQNINVLSTQILDLIYIYQPYFNRFEVSVMCPKTKDAPHFQSHIWFVISKLSTLQGG